MRKRPRSANELQQIANELRVGWVAGDPVVPFLRRALPTIERMIHQDDVRIQDIAIALGMAGIAYQTGNPWSVALLNAKLALARSSARDHSNRSADKTVGRTRSKATSSNQLSTADSTTGALRQNSVRPKIHGHQSDAATAQTSTSFSPIGMDPSRASTQAADARSGVPAAGVLVETVPTGQASESMLAAVPLQVQSATAGTLPQIGVSQLTDANDTPGREVAQSRIVAPTPHPAASAGVQPMGEIATSAITNHALAVQTVPTVKIEENSSHRPTPKTAGTASPLTARDPLDETSSNDACPLAGIAPILPTRQVATRPSPLRSVLDLEGEELRKYMAANLDPRWGPLKRIGSRPQPVRPNEDEAPSAATPTEATKARQT